MGARGVRLFATAAVAVCFGRAGRGDLNEAVIVMEFCVDNEATRPQCNSPMIDDAEH